MDLKELLGEELAAKVSTLAQEKGLNFLVDKKDSPTYIPKNRFDEVIGEKNGLKSQVGELSSQLEALKKAAKGNDDLTKQIEELQKKNGEWEQKHKTTVLDAAIKLAAVTAKAKDANDVLAFIDKSKLEIAEDGTIKGLDDQLKKLSESKPYLFGEIVPATPGNNPPPGNKTELQQLKEQLGKTTKLDERIMLQRKIRELELKG